MLREALKNVQSTGERFLLWRVHASLGHLYQVMNTKADAQKEHSAARELLDELAGTIPDERLKNCYLQGAHHVLIKFPPPG